MYCSVLYCTVLFCPGVEVRTRPGEPGHQYAARTASLPYGQQASPGAGSDKSATMDVRNGSESGSEHDERRSSKRNSVFGFLRRNKKDKHPAQV